MILVDIIACPEHVMKLCSCPITQKVLRYRYKLNEMPDILKELAVRIESYNNWTEKVKVLLSAATEQTDDHSSTHSGYKPGEIR